MVSSEPKHASASSRKVDLESGWLGDRGLAAGGGGVVIGEPDVFVRLATPEEGWRLQDYLPYGARGGDMP